MASTETLNFDGPVYVHERDSERLTTQFTGVRDYMLGSYPKWSTLTKIAEEIAQPQCVASVSAQLRHMRKSRFGGYHVEKRYVANGLWEYRAMAAGSQ